MLNGGALSEVSEPEAHLKKGKIIANGQLFDQNLLTETWKAFAESVDAAQLKSALSVRDPILKDDFNIEYNLDNEVQRQRIIQDLKPKLLAYLHRKLNNDSISIEFNVTENLEEIMNKPYTDQEKFNTLLAKYPLLGIMKQRFGLDFE
jgi:DNA polymerase-3 subunit gamma/tau